MAKDKGRILRKWWNAFEINNVKLLPEIRTLIEASRKELPDVLVWLGGPGRGQKLFPHRKMVRDVLKMAGFRVIFSESYSGGVDLASQEIGEIDAASVVLLLAISPGSSAEAIEFCYLEGVRSKLHIYYPREHRRSYVYRSLAHRHRVVPDINLFSLSMFRKCDPDLPVKLLKRATEERMNLYRTIRQQRHHAAVLSKR